MPWWKHGKADGRVERDADQFIQAHGDRAEELARLAARIARNKRNHNKGRHYSRVALRIGELKLSASNVSVAEKI